MASRPVQHLMRRVFGATRDLVFRMDERGKARSFSRLTVKISLHGRRAVHEMFCALQRQGKLYQSTLFEMGGPGSGGYKTSPGDVETHSAWDIITADPESGQVSLTL